MKIIVSIGYIEHIFNSNEYDEAMYFALSAAKRQTKEEKYNVEITFTTEEEEDDNGN